MWRKRKSSRRRFSKWGKIFWIIPFFLVLIFLYLFFKSGIFNIKQVEVQVNQLGCTSENQIRDFVNLSGQNFFLIDSTKIESNLKKKFFCIKSAPVSKYFPSKINIKTFGREAAAILVDLKEKEASVSSLVEIATPSAQQTGEIYRVDTEGVVFSKDTGELNVPKIYVFDPGISLGKKLENDLIGNSLKILGKVKTFGIPVKESWIFDNFLIVNSEISKFKIIFRLDEKIDLQLASLQLILDKAKIDLKELEFIDLRFDKPIVKFAPQKKN